MKRLLTLLLAGLLVLAACGDDDDSTGVSGDAGSGDDEAAEGSDDDEAAPGEDWPDELIFTLTPSAETAGLVETAEPLADMLEERLGVEVSASVPTDYAGVIVALQSGQAHIAGGLGPLQMVQAHDEANAELMFQVVRFGSAEYVTQWFTNDPDTYCDDEPVADEDGFLFCNGTLDAEIPDGPYGADQLAQLEGETVAFVEQGSTSGYAIPLLQLAEAGIDPAGGVEALFAGGHEQAVQAVYDGEAPVGVSFNDARGSVVEVHPDVGEKVVVFGWSGPIPNDGFAVAEDLPDDLVDAIRDAFLDIAETEDGLALLQELYEIDGFEPAESTDYDVIREVQAELADVIAG